MFDLAPSAGLRTAACRAVALLSFVVALASPSLAHAEGATAHSVPVAVLPLDSDDAEEHADALTSAIRSRVRASEGWSLVETSQSLAMLMAALRCTKPLTAECEEKLAEQIKSERFAFGWVTKGPARGDVSAEVRLYQRGKPTTVGRERYADNLKDQNDDALRAIAQGILERLGENALGSILVRAGTDDGEIIVDGSTRLPLTNGTAKLALSPGSHSVEVVVSGQPPQKRNVLVTVGKETLLELEAPAPAIGYDPPSSGKPFPVRAVVGGALVTAGLAAGVVSIVNFVAWEDDQALGRKHQNDTNPQVWKLPPGKTTSDVCGNADWKQQELCKVDADAKRHSTIAIATAVGGGLLVLGGAYFLLTSGSGGSEGTKTGGAAPKPKVAPVFGPGSGGIAVTGAF